MGVRTFFLQPFKIPTGSMQPTLYGVTSENLRDRPDFQIPTGLERIKQRFQGVSYTHLKSKVDGRLETIEKPRRLLIFNLWQRLRIGGEWHTIWFPPDYGNLDLEIRAEIREGQGFRRGGDVVKLKVRGGDHLFVDRLSYNFRRPRRGEIFVFETRGILELPQDQYYIKRLVALPNETVRIGDDQHLIIDEERLDASTPRFENVYTFSATEPPGKEDGYFGHVNDRVGSLFHGGSQLAPLFPNGDKPYPVPDHHYLAMGDNTLNSFDSRRWGPVSRTNVIGKAWFVYWPLTERFGWGFR
jgi:signal peptidase I